MTGSESVDVVSVIQSFRPVLGGAQLQLERLLPLLAERSVNVTVLTKRVRGVPARETVGGATIRRIGLPGASPVASLAFVLASLAFVLRRRSRVDIVHAYGALSEGLVALGADVAGIPAVVRILRTGHLGDVERVRSKKLGAWRWRRLAARAWFVALSEETRLELIGAGVPEGRIARIPNGVDATVFSPADPGERTRLRNELDLPAGSVAVYAGRLWPEKRLDLVIGALAGLPGLALVLVGEGREAAALLALAEQLDLGARVRVDGPTDRVADYLRAADLFVLPSRSEGMSNSLLEAMSCGLACLAAPVSGVDELLADGRGVIVVSDAPSAWAAAMRRLVSDDDQRDRIGERASAHVREQLTLGSTANRTRDLYRRILEGTRKAG